MRKALVKTVLPHSEQAVHASRRSTAEPSPLPPAPRGAPGPVCTCGGACPRCKERDAGWGGSPEFPLSQPGSPCEQEADRVADAVMRMQEPTRARCGGGVERQQAVERAVNVTLDRGACVPRSAGRPLDRGTRSFFEQRLGHDFQDVRVHTGSEAERAARAIDARAYARGHHLVFDRGAYRPDTGPGRRLLAHELTHVVQQRSVGRPVIQRQLREGTTESDVSPEEEFIRDLHTGTQKATDYVNYITRAIEYWREYGTRPGRLDDALENLSRITSRLSGGLEQFGRVLGMAERALQIRRWFDELNNFAAATRSLDFSNRESVQQWADSMEELTERTEPFVEAAGEWLAGLARRGSPAAARASLFLSVLSSYAEVGAAALRAGINNVNAYIDRQERIIDEAFAEAEGRTRRIPSEPSYPGDWSTAAEQRQRAQARAEYERLARERLEEERRAREAQRAFDEEEFPRIYRRNRSRIKRRILRDIRQGRPTGRIVTRRGTAEIPGLPAQRWWDQFTSSEEETYFDERAGVYIIPKKDRVTAAEAADEIDNFQRVRPPCPYFDELYATRLASFLKERVGTSR